VRTRLIAVLVGVVVLVLAVQDIPLASYLRSVERDRLVTRLERDAFVLAGRVEEVLEFGGTGNTDRLESLVERYEITEDVRVVVIDVAGAAVLGPSFDVGEDFTNRPEILDALAGRPVTGERVSTTLGTDLFYVAVPVISGNTTVGAVRITAPASTISGAVNSRLAGLGAVVLISVVIAVIAAFALAGAITRPITRLTATTRRLAAGDLSDRADEDSGPPEVRSLARSFNTMVGRLEQMVDRQRGFAGTASHQLRTPLTALRLRLESAAVADEQQLGDHLEAALAETDRLGRIIEGLLVLSRAEGADVTLERSDVRAVIRERCEHWEPLADEHEVRLVVVIDDALMSVLVIDNYIDNALDVAPRGSTITVGAEPVDDGMEIRVRDEGPGLSAEERAEAFGRFWRAEGANPGGTGLGLAIVRQLAESSGGRAELRQAPDGGLEAVVFLRGS
jgi:signal transduction histidine kinase